MTYVKKGASLFPSHLCVGIAEDESNGSEEITLPRTIAPYDDIMPGREGFDDGLVLVAIGGISMGQDGGIVRIGFTF